MKVFLALLLMFIMLIPLSIIQGLIFIFGGWTQPSYSRYNIVFEFMDWIGL